MEKKLDKYAPFHFFIGFVLFVAALIDMYNVDLILPDTPPVSLLVFIGWFASNILWFIAYVVAFVIDAKDMAYDKYEHARVIKK